ncbi:hypothetical protein DOZ91_19410 [Peribacillus frigoritolerans]|nr:hypothetical protein DOZ91_19410 [Peribacillus frigoritolerans]
MIIFEKSCHYLFIDENREFISRISSFINENLDTKKSGHRAKHNRARVRCLYCEGINYILILEYINSWIKV